MSLPPGARIGPLVVIEMLGEGGMGAVYRARDERLGREVAVKIASAALAREPELAKRFLREARTMAAVASPHVARVHEVVDHGGLPLIIMELLAGGSLAGTLRTRGTLPWREAVRHAIDIARGLAAIHALGLVHRDLKPGNVLLDGEGRCKLADFGLVGLTAEARLTLTRDLTRAGDVLGTLSFMAPEQADGRKVGPAADLYSLGATIFALVTGKPPFKGQEVVLLKKVLMDTPPRLDAVAKDVPRALADLVASLLAKDPARRPSSDEVVRALEEIARGADPPRRSRRRLALALSAVLLLGIGVGAVALRAGRPAAVPRPVAPTTATPPTAKPVPALPAMVFSREWLTQPGFAHPCWITDADLSPDGRSIATCGLGSGTLHTPGCVVVRSLASGETRALRGFHGSVLGVAFSPNGAKVAAVSDDELRIFDLETGEERAQKLVEPPRRVAFAGSDDRILVLHERSLETWSARLGLQATKAFASPATSLAAAKGAARAVTGHEDGSVMVWDVEAKESSVTPGPTPVRSVAISADGEAVLVARTDGTLTVHEAGRKPALVARIDGMAGAIFAPDERSLIVATERAVLGYERPEPGTRAKSLWTRPLASPVRGSLARFVASGDRALVAGSQGEEYHLIDLVRHDEERGPEAHGRRVRGLVVAGEHRDRLVSGAEDGHLIARSLDGAVLHDIPLLGASITAVAESPQGRFVAAVTFNGRLTVAEAESFAFVAEHIQEAHLLSVVFTDEDRLFAGDQSDEVLDWQRFTDRPWPKPRSVFVARGATRCWVNALAPSSATNGLLIAHDCLELRPLGRLDRPGEAFEPTSPPIVSVASLAGSRPRAIVGRGAPTGGAKTKTALAAIVDTETGHQDPLSGHEDTVIVAAASAAPRAVTAGWEGLVILWDTNRAAKLATLDLAPLGDAPTAVALDAAGERLYVGTACGRTGCWHVRSLAGPSTGR